MPWLLAYWLPMGLLPHGGPKVRGTAGSRSFATSSTCSPGNGRGPRLVKPMVWTGGRTVTVSSLCRCGILTTGSGGWERGIVGHDVGAHGLDRGGAGARLGAPRRRDG